MWLSGIISWQWQTKGIHSCHHTLCSERQRDACSALEIWDIRRWRCGWCHTCVTVALALQIGHHGTQHKNFYSSRYIAYQWDGLATKMMFMMSCHIVFSVSFNLCTCPCHANSVTFTILFSIYKFPAGVLVNQPPANLRM